MVVQGNLNVTGQFLRAHLSQETIEVSEICAEILVNPSRRRNAGPEIDLIWLHHINADNVVDVGTRFREELYRISSSEFLIFVLANAIEKLIADRSNLRLGINKISELARLVYEIGRRENISPESILGTQDIILILNKKSSGYLAKFKNLKTHLLKRRYPPNTDWCDLRYSIF